MLINIDILLDIESHDNAKYEAANNIIKNYKLPLTIEEILNSIQKYKKKYHIYRLAYTHKRLAFLFNALLDDNLDMFVAIIKENKIHASYLFVNSEEPYYVGYMEYAYRNNITNAYISLLNYANFNTDNIKVPLECKLKIQSYQDKKYNGKFTKFVK